MKKSTVCLELFYGIACHICRKTATFAQLNMHLLLRDTYIRRHYMVDYVNLESVSPANVTDGRVARSKFWVALHTRPRSEKKVNRSLNDCGIETYLPLQKQVRQWSDRKKLVEVAVIPMVVFAHIVKEDLLQIMQHPLILRPFMMPGSKDIAAIPDKQIEKLKFILGQSDYPVTFESMLFKFKDKVRVIRGSLMGLTGEVLNANEGSPEIIVNVCMLGCARMCIDKRDLDFL